MVGSSESRTKNRQWTVLVTAIIVIVAVACLSAVSTFVYMGAFDVSADTPHSQPVYWLMQTVREYSIAARSRDAVPNDLSDAKRVTSGLASMQRCVLPAILLPACSGLRSARVFIREHPNSGAAVHLRLPRSFGSLNTESK